MRDYCKKNNLLTDNSRTQAAYGTRGSKTTEGFGRSTAQKAVQADKHAEAVAKWDAEFNAKHLASSPSELLPNRANAIGTHEKLVAYSLNPEHPSSKNKAIVFQGALGV